MNSTDVFVDIPNKWLFFFIFHNSAKKPVVGLFLRKKIKSKVGKYFFGSVNNVFFKKRVTPERL